MMSREVNKWSKISQDNEAHVLQRDDKFDYV